jgi:anti-sigma B factor antagonist
VLNISSKNLGGLQCIRVEGEIDMSVSPDVRTALQNAFKKSPKGVIVDLSGVPYMDSSGIATLVEGMQWSTKERARFILVGVQEKVMNTLKLARLNELFDIHFTEDDALKSLAH